MHVHPAEELGRLVQMPATRFALARPREGPAESQVTATEKRPKTHLLRDTDGLLEGRLGLADRGFAGTELAQDAQRFRHQPALAVGAGHAETTLDVGHRLSS